MVGILIATHGEMAKGMCDAIDMICGKQENFDFVSLERGQDVDEFGEMLSGKVEELDNADGVVIMVDLLGASPMNQSSLILYNKQNVELVTGVNLPMVVVATMERDTVSNAKELVEKIMSDGKESILNIRELLSV